jgi:cytochrome c peroxidase
VALATGLLALGVVEQLNAQGVSFRLAESDLESELVPLGEYLFRSPALSLDGSVSCQTCHIPALGFSGNRPLPIGVAGYTSSRRAPALLGLRHAKHLMWDGRAPDLRSQVAIPLESPEMAIDWPLSLSRLRSDPLIDQIASRAGLRLIDRDLVLRSLASYVASLDAGESRFDRYYFGHQEKALTEQEIFGFRLFVHKARCSSCHLVNAIEAPFTDDAFHATGIGCRNAYCVDHGRAINGNPGDEAAFKTPSLRGVALRPYLMHDGSIASLREAVERYNRGPRLKAALVDDRLGPLYLSADEVNAIVAFMGTLTPINLAGQKSYSSTTVSKETE